MTFNWRGKRNTIGRHLHTDDQIIDSETADPATFGTGAGVTVDNQDDPPSEVTTLVVPGATIVGDAADLSGALSVRRLGPFEMTFAQADGNAVSLTTIPAGALVIVVVARVTADFSDEVNLTLGIGSTLDPEDNHSLTTINNLQTFNEFWGADFGFSKNSPAVQQLVGFAINDADLVAIMDPTGAAPTTGTLDVYALVAEPA